MKWKPIESAPKDGVYILGMSIGHALYKGCVEDAYSMVWFNNNWCTWDGEYADSPTHWMPLPPLPETSDGETK